MPLNINNFNVALSKVVLTTNHKQIGTLYTLLGNLLAGVIGRELDMIIRLELVQSGNSLLE